MATDKKHKKKKSKTSNETSEQPAKKIGTARTVWALYRTFGPHLKPYFPWFAIGYTLMAATIFLKVVTPFPLKWILDYVLLDKPLPAGRAGEILAVFGGDAQGILSLLCIGMVALVVFESFFAYTYRYMVAAAAERANNDIRTRVFNRLQILSLSFHGRLKSGDLVVRLTDDIKILKKLLIDSVSDFLKLFFTFTWITALMAAMNWQLTLLALVVVPPIYYSASVFRRKIEKFTRIKRAKESEVGALVQENVSSMAVIQAFVQEDQEKQRFRLQTDESLRADLRRIQLARALSRAIDILVALGSAGVVYYAGTLALRGRLEATDLVVFVPWLKELYSPLSKLAELLVDVTQQIVCGERIAEILRTKITVADATDAIQAPPFRGEVRFDQVTFGYKDDIPILKNLTFTAQPGQTVALVGSSGAGKSTAVNLLLRFFDPWEGAVLIDGQDIRRFTLESLRSQINVVLQDSVLFRRTIKENVAYGKPKATMEEIVQAARAAQVHDFIEQLPEGYDTCLDERATNLSGGQKQRLALARAILRDAPILILDEPVTQLDSITAARVAQAVTRATQGKTTFVVAHRLSTIQRADLILVIEEGRIVEQGTHADLMTRSELYRQLYETRYAHFDSVATARASA